MSRTSIFDSRFIHRLRVDRQDGFTLIELLVVIVIIGILLAIAVPSYLGFRKQAQDTSGKAIVREAVPSAESYFASKNTYSGMDQAVLKAIDPGLSATVQVGYANASSYCVKAGGAGTTTWYFAGPGGTITSTNPGSC